MEKNIIESSLKKNESTLKDIIGESFDIKYRHLKIPAFNDSEAMIVYVSGMTDSRVIDETILEPLMQSSIKRLNAKDVEPIEALMEHDIFTSAAKETKKWDEICDAVFEGDTVLLIDQSKSALILNTRKYQGRSIDEPSIEGEIKGPRDGFVENIQTNAALIRRRIKDHGLRFDKMQIGERTKTSVSVAYIKGIVNEGLLEEVNKRLNRIDTDAIIDSESIEEFICDSPLSIFSSITNTERPDKACRALLEGRVIILVDNTPFVDIVPAVFWEFFTTSGDYYENYIFATFIRWIRYIALFLSISASSFYVLLTSYHQEMLPTALALKIATDRSGVPFPAVLEAMVMEVTIEIMKEAGLRLPKPIGQTVGIVGTLVIGQAAVSAGLVSPLLVIIIAIEAISSFAIPSYSMSNTIRLLRFPLLFLTAFLGLLGYLSGIIVLLLYLMSLRSFGTQYLTPVIPFDKEENKDIFIRAPRWSMRKRPRFVKPKDMVKQATNLKPEPPSE